MSKELKNINKLASESDNKELIRQLKAKSKALSSNKTVEK